ncbi:PREDICTED: WD repeat-containing protein 44-like [Tarenaya hassleriana]|uniref:WD repeat-containing protein 44-like n=1 Tax=Tarenaya hassleriana TaxID=28532 RepID=UPI00053CA665|nr:PREDICTED: WD repeat-containing protein 44-like [Tarenaya hassleriana]XP_010555743.1 PREDICTED: WD repeat-containing protein 44-like [Tarenaya hassleriana]
MLGQEEDLPFFDAYEDMASSSILTGSNDSDGGSFLFDVWNSCNESVMERRRKFLEWMGVDEERVRPENSVSASDAEPEFDTARENQTGHGGFSSSNTDLSGELPPGADENVRGGCDGTRTYSSSMASCSNSRSYQGKESEKQSNILGMVKSFKKGWFGRLRSMGCAIDEEVESGRMRASGYGGLGSVHRICRVKVKHCRKQVKEFSAIYQRQNVKAHKGSILTMKFSCDGKYLASAGEDGVIRVWKVSEDKLSRQRDFPEIESSCTYFEVDDDLSRLKPVSVDRKKTKTKMPKGLRTTSGSACVVFPSKVFRIKEKPLHEFRGHKGEILDISWSSNNYLLSASMDNDIRLWRVGGNDCLGVFPHNSYVTSVQFNPANENYFISGSIDGKVRIWEISGRRVVDWADNREIISAVCYRPDGQGGIIGSLTGNCRFFDKTGEYLELDSRIHILNKKKSLNKRITGFKFLPRDPSKVLVVSADSQVRILQGNNVIGNYKGMWKNRSLTFISLTSDGNHNHIVSACEDSNVYIWNRDDAPKESDSCPVKKIRSFERFSTDASVATTWCGFPAERASRQALLPFPSPPFCLSLEEGFGIGMGPSSFKRCPTWPEENLPAAMPVSRHKFLSTSSLAWGTVIVTGGRDGRIRTFQNYGLPVVT